MLSSYANVAGLELDALSPQIIVPGDLCTTGISQFPQWRVICVSHGKAWVTREDVAGHDGIVPVERLRRVEDEPLAEAA